MLWPDDLGGPAGLENCPDTVSADMTLCVVESRGEGDVVEKQPDGPGGVDARENPRLVVGQRDAMSRSMIGWEHRSNREEMSTSPIKGTSPPSAATPAPRERRHDAATKSDTAPGSAAPVDRYPRRASATLKRRSDDSIDGSPTSHYVFDQPPTCRLPTSPNCVRPAAHAQQGCPKVGQITTHASK